MNTSLSKFAGAVAALCVGVSLIGSAAAEDSACGRTMSRDQRIQRLLDIAEIANVASLHEYYHTALMHQAEIENIWSARDDVSWTNNTDRYASRQSFWKFYVDGMVNVQPAGAMWYHMLTTPVIEVAGDGQTAKAAFMSFGNVSGSMGGGAPASQWTQEKYGVDFIKENGHWKIWHLRTYVDFYVPTDKSWLNSENNMAAVDTLRLEGRNPDGSLAAGVQEEPGVSFTGATPDEKRVFYEGYNSNRHPVLAPDLPHPYGTWSDVTAY